MSPAGRSLLRRSALALCAMLCATAARAQVAGRIIEDIDVIERAGYVDVNMVFTCTARYLGHLPSSEGASLRIRTAPQANCGVVGDNLAPPTLPSKTRGYLQGVDLDRPVSTEVDITLRWRQTEKFLLIPAADGRGFRIRLLRPGEQPSRVIVGTTTSGRSASYAINLESSQTPFSAADIAAAAQAVGARAYVSEYAIGEDKWHRLRIGPFATEADARRTLLAARAKYPKAWLAIADDELLNRDETANAITRAIEPTVKEAPKLAPAELDAIIKQAKTAFRKKNYAVAIPLLQKLLDQPEHPQRAEAQELMGLARERYRQIAHAKAEYQEYLRRYPNGPAAHRVRERLHALDLAARRSVPGLGGGDGESSPWKLYGGFGQIYRRDNTQFQSGASTTNTVNQSALLNDFALIARRHGERYDFVSRVGASYMRNFLDTGLPDQTRVSAASVELSDRQLGWRTRLGRQSVSGNGIYGTFDGLYADYQVLPRLRFDVAGGAPVEVTAQSFDSNRRFATLGATFGPYYDAWDITTYATAQTYEGETDRRAAGTEVHYFAPGRTVIALVDYDFYYRELNNAMMIGTFQLPARWTLNMNYDRRNAPMLSARNALIGQTVTTLSDLLALFTREQIDQLARDRTSIVDLYSVSVSHPAGEHWQWTLDASRFLSAAMPDSGGVPATPAAPPEMAYSALAIGNSVFTNGDLQVAALRYQTSTTANTVSAGFSTRWPLWSAWRIGPRLRVDRRAVKADNSTHWIYAPSLRLDYQTPRIWLEFEGGTEIGKISSTMQDQKTTHNYFSVGYRWQF